MRSEAVACQPPTAMEEIGYGLRYVGRCARRRLRKVKRKIGWQTGYTDPVTEEAPRDAEGPTVQASPVSTNVAEYLSGEDGWMDVLSDTEWDTSYQPRNYRPRRPAGPIMQTISSTMERASSARQSICSTDLKPSTFGDAFSGGLTRPRHCTRARSHTSDGQLAEEHAWMSTKLPPQSPHKRLGEEPMNIEHLSLNNSSASALSLGLDHHSTFSLEADFLEASTVPGVRMGSIANEEAADSMEVLGSGLKDMNLDDDRKELMRKDMKYPQDAPEGRKLDHRAIASEKVENLPHKGYFEASYGPLKKVKAVRSGVFNSSKKVEKMRVIGQYSRNDLQTDPTTMFDQDFKPTLGMRRFSDQGPVNPYKKNNETFEVHKSAQHFDHEDELEEGSEGVHKEGRSAKFVSEKKKGKQPIYPGCMDKPYMSEEDDNLVDVDLNDKDDGPGGKQNDEYVDEWLSNECDEAMEVEEA